jgi:hypothetical protein
VEVRSREVVGAGVLVAVVVVLMLLIVLAALPH